MYTYIIIVISHRSILFFRNYINCLFFVEILIIRLNREVINYYAMKAFDAYKKSCFNNRNILKQV